MEGRESDPRAPEKPGQSRLVARTERSPHDRSERLQCLGDSKG